ncbi:citrate synthase [bacterium E08(2017)]|nr:citrate synthase [bacterium E08(2017)]
MASVRMSKIKKIIKAAGEDAKKHRSDAQPAFTGHVKWPVECTVGPGLEGAIACETKVGYVDGTNGSMLYQGYDIYDLCANSNYEEVCYLLLHGRLPSDSQLQAFNKKLIEYRFLPNTLRRLMSFPVEEMNPMAALRVGTNFMRQRLTWRDKDWARVDGQGAIATDEDSIPMETMPFGEDHAVYEFKAQKIKPPSEALRKHDDAESIQSCMHLISGVATIAAAIKLMREGQHMPLNPDPKLSHAGNLLYMMNGRKPTPEEEKIMDVILILHADHGMNASTFASMVVSSTMSDYYLSIGAGISALNGPLHGGANEEVVRMLQKIGSPKNVDAWLDKELKKGTKIPGFGHRVYKTYDPRARILGPLAKMLAESHPESKELFATAAKLERAFVSAKGREKKIFPNVDFYSGLVYSALDIPMEMYTTMFAVSRVAGWAARVHEYHKNNRIFRPRAIYSGGTDKEYVPVNKRG